MKLISNLLHKCSQGVTFPPLPYTFLSPVIEERKERLTEKRDMSALFTGGAIIRKVSSSYFETRKPACLFIFS